MKPTPAEIAIALETFVKSGSANGNEPMRRTCLKVACLYPELVQVLKDLTETGHTPEDADHYRRKAMTEADDLLEELGELLAPT